jgi:hypothetical protein
MRRSQPRQSAPLADYTAEWEALEHFRDTGEVPPDPRNTRRMMARVMRHAEWGDVARGYKEAAAGSVLAPVED